MSMGEHKISYSFATKKNSFELEQECANLELYAAKNEIFSCEFSKMKTSDIVQVQNQKNLQNEFEVDADFVALSEDDYGSMGVSFDEHRLMGISDSENVNNSRWYDSNSSNDYLEEDDVQMFDKRAEFCENFNESAHIIDKDDFIDFSTACLELAEEDYYSFELDFAQNMPFKISSSPLKTVKAGH